LVQIENQRKIGNNIIGLKLGFILAVEVVDGYGVKLLMGRETFEIRGC